MLKLLWLLLLLLLLVLAISVIEITFNLCGRVALMILVLRRFILKVLTTPWSEYIHQDARVETKPREWCDDCFAYQF